MNTMTARVAISHTKEKHRSPERVEALVEEALRHLGGISAFVAPGQTVFIKPNQTVFYSAEEGCTTDPLVVGALIRLCKRAGASRVSVGDSSGDFFDSIKNMHITGMAQVVEKNGAELVDLGSDDVPNRTVPIPHGTVIKEVPLPAPLLDADVIINVPKAKNHHIEPITGALKNWVGAVNRTWRAHNHGDEDMIERFMDIMTVSRPHLCVVDALICGEGDGPIANQPHWCGAILASDDPVATDVAIARLMGHDWRKLRFAEEAEKRNLGTREHIEYLGVPLESIAFKAWEGHRGYSYLPVNFLVGEGVTLEGTIGHVRSALDSLLRRGELSEVIWLKGTPTFMVGQIEDPQFEEHIKEGPYLVFDDAALPRYKHDSRVTFIPGHPVLRDGMPGMMKGLGVTLPGQTVMQWQQFQRWGMHLLEYGSARQIARAAAKTAAGTGLALAGAAALVMGVRRFKRHHT